MKGQWLGKALGGLAVLLVLLLASCGIEVINTPPDHLLVAFDTQTKTYATAKCLTDETTDVKFFDEPINDEPFIGLKTTVSRITLAEAKKLGRADRGCVNAEGFMQRSTLFLEMLKTLRQ